MARLLARLWILFVLTFACVMIYLIAIRTQTRNVDVQIAIAVGVCGWTLYQSGLDRGVSTIITIGYASIWFVAMTFVLVRFGVLNSDAYATPLILFSSVIAFQLTISWIGLRHIMLAIRPGGIRSLAAVLRGVLTTGAADIKRVSWHVAINNRSVPSLRSRIIHFLIARPLGIVIWTLREVPKRIETYENRIAILGG